MSPNNRQGQEHQNFDPFIVVSSEIVFDEYEADLNDWKVVGGFGKLKDNTIFPPVRDHVNNPEISSNSIQQWFIDPSTSAHGQISVQHIESSEQSESSEDESQGHGAVKKQARKRKDPYDLSQNISSKARSLICKLMARSRPKDWKKTIKDQYNKFLKENSVAYSQIVLIFSYLFMVERMAAESIYAQFKGEFLKYLRKRWEEASQNSDPAKRDALFVKIRANIQLIEYLFELKGQRMMDFDELKSICQPLFAGRQAKRINQPLAKALSIQQNARTTEQISFYLDNLFDRQTSNNSTGEVKL